MSLPAHVEIIGTRQGMIEGSCDMRGREGTIFVNHIRHKIIILSDSKDGKRVHTPYKITKKVDTATPKLNQAMASGELLRSVIIKWYRIDPTGHEEQYFTQKLENALIKSISNEMEAETVAFSYEHITWIWESPHIESSDSWR